MDVEDGMEQRCAATLDNVRPVRRALLTSRITALGATKMHAVCQALGTAVAC